MSCDEMFCDEVIVRRNDCDEVDVIIASSSSAILQKAILDAAGEESQRAYDKELKTHSNATLFTLPSGALPCKKIFLVTWMPDKDEKVLQRSLTDLIYTVVLNTQQHNFTSIALPAIGCGKIGCSMEIVVKTMVHAMKANPMERSLPWKVKFVVETTQAKVYEEFCKQLLTKITDIHEPVAFQLPTTWEHSPKPKIRFILSPKTDEYQSIVSYFNQTMKGRYTNIIKIERIQNERWYKQYFAHYEEFKKRLQTDTQEFLYHGCPEGAVDSIIKNCFNRSYAGANATRYGIGAYFSAKASYSHNFAIPNENEEQCMFLARVLVGETVIGDENMKTPPDGYDSTTDGDHIFVTYYDSQAYAAYLITYK
ncbi:unnamed protein product [Rotaria magnacalcarata]|uniref:Poly [ADP-ribose] polymerase n=2 Tax=Rotaria magnacalcarata TaxID=392030 RepID=A0A816QFF3_9BILA|nr:unnamed protein product [Rotaria magnacalcarata]